MKVWEKFKEWMGSRELEKNKNRLMKKYGAITFCPSCGETLQENSDVHDMGDDGMYCFECWTCGEKSIFHYGIAPVPVLLEKDGAKCPQYVGELFSDEIDELMESFVDVFTQMAVEKRRVMAMDKGIHSSDESLQYVSWDTDVFGIDSPIHDRYYWDQLDLLAMFLLTDRDSLIGLYSKVNDFDDFHDLFVHVTGSTVATKEEHIEQFVYNASGEDYIEEKCSNYGEPGYNNEEEDKEVLLANWNSFPGAVLSILEYDGYGTEWGDEWICLCEGDAAYRTMPDSYGWQPSFFYYSDEPIPISGNEELYLEEMINNPRRLVREDMNLKEYGFVDLEEVCHQTGWYGQMDDPQDYFDKFRDDFSEIVVQACSIGPFSVEWKVFGRNNDELQ